MAMAMKFSDIVTKWFESKGYEWTTCDVPRSDYFCIHIPSLIYDLILVKNSHPTYIIYECPIPQEFDSIDPECFLKLEASLK